MMKFKNPLFIDSGAHGLYTEFVINKKHKDGYSWYSTQAFWDYIDEYAEFIQTYNLENYANVDVIFNHELSWKVQHYLEKKGLHPIPVIHHNTPLTWLSKYLSDSYPYIALGGLGQEVDSNQYIYWADKAFNMICDQSSRLPKCKVHGFAVTAHHLMRRYPWYSVDSTTWIKLASYGKIIMPVITNDNVKRYDLPYQIYKVSSRKSKGQRDIALQDKSSKKLFEQFLAYITEKGFIVGSSKLDKDKNEVIIESGLSNNSDMRCTLNAIYFLDLIDSMPKWPWAFKITNKTLLQ